MIQNIEFIKLKKIILYLNMLRVTQLLEKKTHVKESRFSYIIPIHGSTRLIVYNSSNVTSMEGQVHCGAKVIVEVPEGCMIIFTSDTFHASVKTMQNMEVIIYLIFVYLHILLKIIILLLMSLKKKIQEQQNVIILFQFVSLQLMIIFIMKVMSSDI